MPVTATIFENYIIYYRLLNNVNPILRNFFKTTFRQTQITYTNEQVYVHKWSCYDYLIDYKQMEVNKCKNCWLILELNWLFTNTPECCKKRSTNGWLLWKNNWLITNTRESCPKRKNGRKISDLKSKIREIEKYIYVHTRVDVRQRKQNTVLDIHDTWEQEVRKRNKIQS